MHSLIHYITMIVINAWAVNNEYAQRCTDEERL